MYKTRGENFMTLSFKDFTWSWNEIQNLHNRLSIPRKQHIKGKGPKNRYTVAANSFSRCNFSGRESAYCLLWIIFSSLLMIMMFYLSIMEMKRKGIEQNVYHFSFLSLSLFLYIAHSCGICCFNFIFGNISFYPPSFYHCLLHPLYIRTLLLSFINHNNILRKYVQSWHYSPFS